MVKIRLAAYYYLAGLVGLIAAGPSGRAALATSVTGLYYTGQSASGGLLSQGTTPGTANSGTLDPAWVVTYASTNGGATAATAYEGTSYVINTTQTTYASQYPNPPWAANTSSAQWITAPGAVYASNGAAVGPANAGGDGLPGYGSDSSPVAMNASNAAIYVYTTTFTITGNAAAGTAVTGFTLNLKVSADNSFDIFVNPTATNQYLNTANAAYASSPNAYTATSAIALSSGFKIGVNTISIQVENAAAANVSSVNYSGLLVYQAGFSGLVPEVGSWLPLAAAAALYGCVALRRRRVRLEGTCRGSRGLTGEGASRPV
jgi:hypothetical protein